MREIAATQAAAGLTPALFEALAEVNEAIATTPAASDAPEEVGDPELADVVARLAPGRAG
jgi:hypothetical protein